MKKAKSTTAELTNRDPADSPTRWPDDQEQLRIAASFGLGTREQSNRFWEPIVDLVIEYRHFRSTIPPAGDDRAALLERIRDLSKTLTKAERLLRRRTSYLDYRLGKLLGPWLGALLSDQAMDRFSGGYAAPYISIHDRAHLESDDGEEPDRISMARYAEAVGRKHLERRQQVASEDACEVLRAFIDSVNQPLLAYLKIARRDRGGSPGRVFRNHAIRRLALIYERTFNKPPTTTVGGQFMCYCNAVLPAIGIETDGLRGAVARELKRLRG